LTLRNRADGWTASAAVILEAEEAHWRAAFVATQHPRRR
jgi:hypothetical protein